MGPAARRHQWTPGSLFCFLTSWWTQTAGKWFPDLCLPVSAQLGPSHDVKKLRPSRPRKDGTQRIESFFTIFIYLFFYNIFLFSSRWTWRIIAQSITFSYGQGHSRWVQRFLASLSIAGSRSDWSKSDWSRSDWSRSDWSRSDWGVCLGSAVWSDSQGVNDGDHEAVAFQTGGRCLGAECREVPLRCSGCVVTSLPAALIHSEDVFQGNLHKPTRHGVICNTFPLCARLKKHQVMDCTDTLRFKNVKLCHGEKKKTRKSKHGEAVIQNNLLKAAETFFSQNISQTKNKNNPKTIQHLSWTSARL